MSIATQPGDVLDYEIPMRGSLKHPEVNLKPIILEVMKNIFVKPPMTPYIMRVQHLENTVEKMLTVDWEPRRIILAANENKFLNTVAKFLKSDPAHSVKVSALIFEDKEKEYIAFFEGKKKYFLSTHNRSYKMSEADSIYIEQFSVKEPAFVRYLDKLGGDSMMFSTEQKCRFAVGDALIDSRFKQLNEARQKAFLEAFAENGTAGQVKFSRPEMGVPHNGFSRYKMDYDGDVPNRLRNAYEAIDQLNQEGPREKYEKLRWLPKIKGVKRKSE